MTPPGHLLSASLAAVAPATPGPPRLDAVFRSLQESTQGEALSIPFVPLLMLVAAAALMTFAVKHWHRRKARPRPLHSHRKLLDEAARAAGVSRRKLRQIAPLTQADGLSSPLVAILCPSAIGRLAKTVRTAEQQAALKGMAQALLKADAGRR